MLRCSRGLRQTTAEATSLDEVATAAVGYLYSEFADPESKEPQCALIRFYRTFAYQNLDAELKEFARAKLQGKAPEPATKILTLVATVGSEPEWCDRTKSLDHQAIPLPSVEIVERAPMIAELIRALGFDIAEVVSPTISLMHDVEGRNYNVFHVENALGSPFIPAQKDFVERYGIKSVIGFGGLLPTGDLFAIVMFSRVHVPPEPAGRFRSVALDVRAILHRFALPSSVQASLPD